MCWDQWIDVLMVIGAWLAGLGTSAAVLFVLFGNRFKKPRLDLDPTPNIVSGIIVRGENGEWTFIRIKIRNRSKYLAKNIIVKVNEVKPVSGIHDDVTRRIDAYRPEIVGYYRSVDIYAHDESNLFDLVKATEDEMLKHKLSLCFSKVAEEYPRAIPERLERDDYIFTVTLYGDNIDPVVTRILVLAKGRNADQISAELLSK